MEEDLENLPPPLRSANYSFGLWWATDVGLGQLTSSPSVFFLIWLTAPFACDKAEKNSSNTSLFPVFVLGRGLEGDPSEAGADPLCASDQRQLFCKLVVSGNQERGKGNEEGTKLTHYSSMGNMETPNDCVFNGGKAKCQNNLTGSCWWVCPLVVSRCERSSRTFSQGA